jgi:hypothetical protein
MNVQRFFSRPAFKAAALVCAMAVVPAVSMAGVGKITTPDLFGQWVGTLSGVTGCGPTAMHFSMKLSAAAEGTGTLTMHGQCGDSVLQEQTFRVLTLDANGTGTANLTCGPGCGWNLRIQVSPDRTIMNLVDVDPVNPGNYVAGVAVHF